MKKYFVFLFPVLFFSTVYESCSKDAAVTITKIDSETIAGNWELRIIHGGFVGAGGDVYYPPGNGNRLNFTETGYKAYMADTIVLSSTYSIIIDAVPETGMLSNILVIHTSFKYELPIEIENDTLIVHNGIIEADGHINKYVKVQ